MIKVDKGKVEIKGKGTEVFAELMIACSEMKKQITETQWDSFAHYFVAELTDVRIYETAGETSICKDMTNLTIGLAYVLKEISKRHGAGREKILKLAFELADDLQQYGDEAVLRRADELLAMEGNG